MAALQHRRPGSSETPSTALEVCWRGPLAWALACCFFAPAASAQQPMPQMGAPATDISVIPRPIDETIDRVRIREMQKQAAADQKSKPENENCLLPPLAGMHGPVVSATELATPVKARYEYALACVALGKAKTDSAEKHLRKAVEIYEKYPAAWVTLGQLLAEENHTAEARSACFHASSVEPNYVPAYLCLTQIAAWGKAWNDVLEYTARAIQLDPITTPIPYEYNADANLRSNRLDDAEKSALRAAEIDKDNKDPRIHFLLAQIYEAKGERANEIAQLRLYLTLAKDVRNTAEIKQFLMNLEQGGSVDTNTAEREQPEAAAVAAETGSSESVETNAADENAAAVAMGSGGASNFDAAAEAGPPGCNLDEVLPQVEKRVKEFVENVQKFTATQTTVFEVLNNEGKVVRSDLRTYDYTVSIGQSAPAMLQVSEYQNMHPGAGSAPEIVTNGLPALLLIFHPLYAGDFAMRCEGSTMLQGQTAWRIRFHQRSDKPSRIRSYAVGTSGRAYPVDLEGSAWFTASTFQIVRLEADLAKKIPEIRLTQDHTAAQYGPVHFKNRGIDIWLPQTVELTSERRGKRFRQRIAFSDYMLFSIDNRQDIAAPKAKPAPPLRFAKLQSDRPLPWF